MKSTWLAMVEMQIINIGPSTFDCSTAFEYDTSRRVSQSAISGPSIAKSSHALFFEYSLNPATIRDTESQVQKPTGLVFAESYC